MERRGFLKFALGGVVGVVASPMIWTTLYDLAYWTQNWGRIPRLRPGTNTYIPTVSKICPGGTPILVRLVDGRVIRTLGNPDNNISEGGLTPLAASEGQLLYTESRIKRPLLRGSDGGHRVITWGEAQKILKEKTKEAKSSCAFISSDPSSTLNELFSAFLAVNGSSDYFYMPSEENAAEKAWALMGGAGRIGYDIENSDYILSIGANLMESWGTVARNRKVFRNSHPTDGKYTMTLAFAGAMQNNTAVISDLWVPIKPGTEAILGLGICRELIRRGLGTKLAGIEEFSALVAPYTITKLQQECGIVSERFKTLVDGLTRAKAPIVLSGSSMGNGSGAAPIMTAIAANMLLGRLGQKGNMVDLPLPTKVLALAQDYRQSHGNNLIEFSQNIAEGRKKAPKLLFLYESNPLYAWPKNVRMQECLDAIDYKISFSGFWDETSAQCDLILPSALGLERFDDVYTPYGSGFENWALAKPVAEPRHQARPVGEVIIALSEELGLDLGVKDVPSLLALRAKNLGADFKQYLENGLTYQVPELYNEELFHFATDILHEAMTSTAGMGEGIRLLPHVVYGIGSASTGIPPYANRIIADYQLKDNLTVAQMNSETAKKLGVTHDEHVNLKTENGSIPVIISLYEGIMTGVVSVTAGLGHTEFDRFSIDKGDNILNLTHVHIEAGTGLPIWSDRGVKVVKG